MSNMLRLDSACFIPMLEAQFHTHDYKIDVWDIFSRQHCQLLPLVVEVLDLCFTWSASIIKFYKSNYLTIFSEPSIMSFFLAICVAWIANLNFGQDKWNSCFHCCDMWQVFYFVLLVDYCCWKIVSTYINTYLTVLLHIRACFLLGMFVGIHVSDVTNVSIHHVALMDLSRFYEARHVIVQHLHMRQMYRQHDLWGMKQNTDSLGCGFVCNW